MKPGAVPGLAIHHDQRGLTPGQPFSEQVVRAGRVLLDIVHDQVPVPLQEISAAGRIGQQTVVKDFQLERKVEQVVGQIIGINPDAVPSHQSRARESFLGPASQHGK